MDRDPTTGAWSALGKLPPSIVFQTSAFLQDEPNKRREAMQCMVEFVESSAAFNLREFIEPTQPPTRATGLDIQRLVAAMAAFISLLEHGALRDALELHDRDLLGRFDAARDEALSKIKSVRAILVAALENAIGEARGESPEERLRRAIEMAKHEEPVSFGSFAQYVDEDDKA